MHDEACPHYEDMITNMQMGHDFVLKESMPSVTPTPTLVFSPRWVSMPTSSQESTKKIKLNVLRKRPCNGFRDQCGIL
jgi:hypothetical protein